MAEETWVSRNHSKIEHSLSDAWELWLDEGEKAFSSSHKAASFVASFKTVQEFWNVYSSMSSLQVMPKGVDVFLIKSGCKPNEGSKITISFTEKVKSEWDIVYQQIVLKCIGSTLNHYLLLNGISYSIGGVLKITLWCSSSSEQTCSKILEDIQTIKDLPEHVTRISTK